MENFEEESVETPEAPETLEKPEIEAEPSLTKEQKSKLDSFDRIYAENKELKAKIASKPEPKKEPEEVEEWIATNDPLEVVRLGKALKDYNEEETEFIIRNSPSKDIEGIMKAEKDPWVQAAIKAQREKVARENKIPEPSSPATSHTREDAQKIVKEGKVAEYVAKKMAELERRGGGEI